MGSARTLAMVSALTTICAWGAQANLVVNPSFEDDEALDDAEGWRLTWNSAGAWAAARDQTQVVEGASSLRLTVPAGGVRYPRVTQAVAVAPHTRYEFACSLRVEEGAVRTWVSTGGWGGELVNAAAPADGDWHRVEGRFDSGEATTVNIMIAVLNPERQAARLWIDDVRLAEAPEQPAAEAPAPEQAARPVLVPVSYDLVTRRSYGTSGESDLAILTDGQWQGGYWTRENTLAWRSGPGQVARVLFDLGERRAIGGLVVAAVRGVAAHPPQVRVRVGDDIHRLFEVAAWDAGAGLEVAPSALSTERSVGPQVRAAGRYVLFELSQPEDPVTGASRSGLICVTELEVLGGEFDPAQAALSGEAFDLEAQVRESDPWRFIPPISTEVETPHLDWAPEPAGGRPRVLTVVNYVCGRDPVELAQRLGMEQRIFALLRQAPRMDRFRTEDLLAELADTPEVLVLAATDWSILRGEARARILELVRGGMGLVWVHPRGEDEELRALLDGLPEARFEVLDTELAALPWALAEELRDGALGELRAGTIGAGRVVAWRWENADGEGFAQTNSALWPQLPPGTNAPEDFAYWELYAAQLAKVVCWAAQGEPAARLVAVETPRVGRAGLTVRARPEGAAEGLRVRVRLLDEHNRVLGEQTGTPGAEIEFAGPLPTGLCAAVAWLEDAQGRQVDWRAALVEIEGPTLAEVTLDAARYEVGETIRATVTCADAGELAAPVVRAELVDAWGGVAARAEAPAGAEAVTLALPTEGARSVACVLHVTLADGAAVVDERFVPVPTIAEVDLQDEVVGLWASYGSYIGKRPWGYAMIDAQRALDVDLAVAGPMPAYPRADMRPCPENMHRIFFKLAEVYENMNLAEPGFRERFLETIRPKMEDGYRWGAYDFSVGDECGYTLRRDEHTLAAFREWLRAQYGTIAALNAAWNASFAEFEAVTFDPPAADPAVTSYAAALDERLFGDGLFIDTLAAARAEAEAIDPRNRLGISGTRDPAHCIGFDWWRLMNTVTHLAYYDGLQRECIRSWRKPGDLLTSFVGYDDADVNEVGARYFPWLEAFSGLQGVSIYSASSGDLGGFVRPDLTLTRRAQWTAEEVAELRGGIAKALLTAERGPAPIAVHYSQRSIHLAKLLGRPALGTLTSVAEIIKDLGLQFDFVSHEQLEAGVARERGYRAFILAESAALSDAEIAALREFAAGGGLVLSFGASGGFDERGVERAANPLEGLATVCAEAIEEYREFQPSGVAGETVERNSARDEVLAAWQARMEELLSPAAIAAPARVRGADGAPRRYVEVVEFARGPVRYVGVLPRYFGGRYARGGEPQYIKEGDFAPATITLVQGGHVYDVRAGEYLGETAAIATTLAPGVARLYAVLPARVTGVAIDCPATVAPGEVLRVRGQVESASGDHVLHVELADPSGTVIRPRAVNVLAEGGAGEVVFPLPHNTAAGTWTVTVREVASGVSAQRTILVAR